MKVKIVKPHPFYGLGGMEIKDDPERANYLIRVGVAEEVKEDEGTKINHEGTKVNDEGTKPPPAPKVVKKKTPAKKTTK